MISDHVPDEHAAVFGAKAPAPGGGAWSKSDDAFCFSHQNAYFSHPCFYMPFLTMKMTESAKIALQYCTIDFNKEIVGLMSNVMNIKTNKLYLLSGIFRLKFSESRYNSFVLGMHQN